jgi:hypothetical protein
VNDDLFLAILSIDAYNRTGPENSPVMLAVAGSVLGNATLGRSRSVTRRRCGSAEAFSSLLGAGDRGAAYQPKARRMRPQSSMARSWPGTICTVNSV